MQAAHSLDRRRLKRILFLVLALILCYTMETMIRTKDLRLFEAWRLRTDTRLTLGDYVAVNIISYLFYILIPIIYVIYLVVADRKLGLTRLGMTLWSILLGAALAFQVLRLDLASVFYYPAVVLLVLLLWQNHHLIRNDRIVKPENKDSSGRFTLQKEE